MNNYHRYPGERKESDPGQYGSLNRWCALCGTHKPQRGGTTKWVMGGRHFVCAKHKKASDA